MHLAVFCFFPPTPRVFEFLKLKLRFAVFRWLIECFMAKFLFKFIVNHGHYILNAQTNHCLAVNESSLYRMNVCLLNGFGCEYGIRHGSSGITTPLSSFSLQGSVFGANRLIEKCAIMVNEVAEFESTSFSKNTSVSHQTCY